MSSIEECLQQINECSKLRNTVPKSCVHKFELNKCTNYTTSKLKKGYKYQQPQRPKACKPPSQNYKINAPYATESIYSCSYMPYDCFKARRHPILHQDQIQKYNGKIEDETVHTMSFLPQCTAVRSKITPKDHYLGGEGPMNTMTTQQHDYYLPCDGIREKIIIPHDTFCKSTCPMTDMTTTRLSYKPVCVSRVKPYKPDIGYIAPVDCMDLNTIHRSSYQIVNIPKKEETPWAIQPKFCRPTEAIECCTIYNKSYMEPGTYVKQHICEKPIDVVPENKLGNSCCLQSRPVKATDFEK